MARNFLILMADELTARVLGCAGDAVAHTPNLDKLARRGTYFSRAYTTCPICVPARASLATGRYVHEIRTWDNATPYTGQPPSWADVLRKRGLQVESIGKLHYRSSDDDVGFAAEHLPMHIADGIGDVLGSIRDPLPIRTKTREIAEKIGPGETSYTEYDRTIRNRALRWLRESGGNKPWTLFVSFVAPHFPLIAPPKFYSLYEGLNLRPRVNTFEKTEHPWVSALRNCYVFDNFDERKVQIALRSYYGLVSFLDDNVGAILDAVDALGLNDNTDILFLSDHGDNLGERGLWGKSTLYEDAVNVPIILSGPNVPAGKICETPVSLIDVYPTIVSQNGSRFDPVNTRAKSLFNIACEPPEANRTIFSEYHAAGATSGAFMIRKGSWKLNYYVGFAPELFDLRTDPYETTNVAGVEAHRDTLNDLLNELHAIGNPEAIDALAKAEQAELVRRHGGVQVVLNREGFSATPVPH